MLKKFLRVTLLFMVILYVGCSEKSSGVTPSSYNETKIESFETGIIVGSLLGHASGTSVVAGTVIGGMVGLSGGEMLEEMQQKYLDKENVMLEKVLRSVRNQERLSYKIVNLNQRIVELDNDISSFKYDRGSQLERKREHILSQIALKKEEILAFQKLNNSAIDDVLAYNNLVSYANYPERKKREMEQTLDTVLANLFTLRKTSNENVKKLENLEERL